jgi:SAM-dependent methyltransferase
VSGPPDFEALYRNDPDPWRVATNWYEQRKIDIVLACLSRPRYDFAWDPACGTGHLAVRLAARADQVWAGDASATATSLTRKRCANLSNVVVREHTLPDPPTSDLRVRPDLIVLSEVFYYLDDTRRRQTLQMIDQQAAPHGELISVHWRHAPHDAWLSGAGAQAEIVGQLAQLGWSHLVRHRDAEFSLDLLSRSGGVG